MLGAFLASLLLTVTVALTVAGSAAVARHRAQASADLAALAAAAALPQGPGPACRRASDIVHSSRVPFTQCVIDGLDVIVTVAVPVRLGRWEVGTARAGARAGPAGATG